MDGVVDSNRQMRNIEAHGFLFEKHLCGGNIINKYTSGHKKTKTYENITAKDCT
jgi:hypothetical protein